MKQFDLVIVGAGLSGIGTAVHVKNKLPESRVLILESRSQLGGTWDLFRYPGIRSDSDMSTMSYDFRPWRETDFVASGKRILDYINEVAKDYKIDSLIRYNHKLIEAHWSTHNKSWELIVKTPSGYSKYYTQCLDYCGGYYKYDSPFVPEIPGIEKFKSPLFHAQQWPVDFDETNKEITVIGSGATAMTLVPALSKKAKKVTMLQRSPSYVISLPSSDPVAELLTKLLPNQTAQRWIKKKNIFLTYWMYKLCQRFPTLLRWTLTRLVKSNLKDLDQNLKHFAPYYNPWDQRLCLIPDGDLFAAINSKKAYIITDQIDSFSEESINLNSGKKISPDAVVFATGLKLSVMDELKLTKDGQPLNLADHITYKGMMYSDIPNFIHTFGYINSSWTLRVDLIADWVARLIYHMKENNLLACTPHISPSERKMKLRPFIENFSSNYIQRDIHRFPKQGEHWPWINPQNYQFELKRIKDQAIEDEHLRFDDGSSLSL
tara:strand:- start:91 stop:1560 length:1470 start_codon:yes stop_codon:yes gene_type:complete